MKLRQLQFSSICTKATISQLFKATRTSNTTKQYRHPTTMALVFCATPESTHLRRSLVFPSSQHLHTRRFTLHNLQPRARLHTRVSSTRRPASTTRASGSQSRHSGRREAMYCDTRPNTSSRECVSSSLNSVTMCSAWCSTHKRREVREPKEAALPGLPAGRDRG